MKNWFLWLVIGAISIIGGVMALTNPLAASMTAERLAGWVFIIAGILQMFTAWSAIGFGAKTWALLAGAAGLFVGITLLANPLKGLMALTMVIGILFLVAGAAKVFTSLSLRGSVFFLPVLISGVLSLILAGIILANYPASAATALGVLLAIELISNGVAVIAISLKRKGDAPAV